MGVRAFAENQEDSLRASSVRVALGLFAAFALPFLVPSLLRFEWVFAAYVVGAVGFRAAIRRGVGGNARVLLGGVMDIAFITFVVHRMGSQSTPLVGAYFLAGMFNALVAPAWTAWLLGTLSTVAYTVVTFAEAFRLIPYAPDVPDLGAWAPDTASAVRAASAVAALMVVALWVCDRIARALRHRERLLLGANSRLEELSLRDPLTQLYNRRHFVKRVEEELLRVRRGHPMVVLMMDLDGFKHINDQQGHLVGDELLVRIARAIEDTTRIIDVVGRFGGDEFVALFPDTDVDQARSVADRVVRIVRAIGTEADPRRPVTASVGLALAHPEDDVTLVLNAADDAAYRAKQAGGDRVYVMPLSSEATPRQSGFRSAAPAPKKQAG